MKLITKKSMCYRFGGSHLCPSQSHGLREQHSVRARNISRSIINSLGPARWSSTSTACHPRTALFFPGTLQVHPPLAMTQRTDFVSQAKASSELAWPLPGSKLFQKHASHFLKRWTPFSAITSPRSLPKAPTPPSQQPKTRNQLSWPHRS